MKKSLLFIPGNKEKMLSKADISNADSIIFDLEDSIQENDKESARGTLTKFLMGYKNNLQKEIIVRINSKDKLWQQDICSTHASNKVNCYMIPKSTPEFINAVEKLLDEIDTSRKIKIIPMIETPESLMGISDIVKASTRSKGMLFGAEDFTTEMGIERTASGDEFFVARSIFAIACAAAKVEAYDTPYPFLKDVEGLERDVKKGKLIGMTGKTAIHPNQVEVINNIYLPKKEELEIARQIIEKNEMVSFEEKGAFTLDGKMVDLPVVLRAKKLLEKIDDK